MFVAPFKTLQDFETILTNVPEPDPEAKLAAAPGLPKKRRR